ncbi:MAG TPA: TIGR03960 family B12-binding radical SAM protein [Candidatus Omnitrophota bacterium]|nr:TIGR03960 family B12-binding radical SAM protein [Candidatus Omnitrophota bacterium]
MLEGILSQINKPGRYIGEEWNISKKDFDKAEIKFALCFPDLYEVGMSNLGMRIIYGILNNIDDVACERFFAVAYDMEMALRNSHQEIFSLESKRPMREFDIIGFSLGYELSYTNVLNILDLGNIPLESDKRDNSYPLIIGGGPCALNPEPMARFFDCFLIGEAEEAIVELADVYRKFKQGHKGAQDKKLLLEELSGIEGVYVPLLKAKQGKIKKRILKDFNQAYFPSPWLVPHLQIVHDRVSLEIMRGCPNQCLFCQAKAQYYPCRIRKPQEVMRLASGSYQESGYEEFSLCGLSVSDYPYLEELLFGMVNFFKDKAVSVSLPSIKPKEKIGDFSGLIATVKKTGLTFAPEAGTAKLRESLRKDFDEENFFKGILKASEAGYRRLKLYFMVGLPLEEEKDLEAIVEFSLKASEVRTEAGKRRLEVNISVNPLIPKPHTPLERLGMQGLDELKNKREILRKKIARYRNLKLNFHNPQMSILEGILSRGDRKLGSVIESAFRKGARFDAWDDYFVFQRWLEAFQESGIDYNFYLQERAREESLPWDFIDVGV